MHTVGPGIRPEKRQMRKMRNSHGRTFNMARNTEKQAKRNTNCNTWNIARNSDKREI